MVLMIQNEKQTQNENFLITWSVSEASVGRRRKTFSSVGFRSFSETQKTVVDGASIEITNDLPSIRKSSILTTNFLFAIPNEQFAAP